MGILAECAVLPGCGLSKWLRIPVTDRYGLKLPESEILNISFVFQVAAVRAAS
ncbi:hypothetical protein XNC1_3778 [Xenorhabdus nematophila ATCC 19061]|uniref:Uncharacterized protein n=1 Tax=Xenorhabdus nematophila (strain ATCC 19061 / DSM 3370 / CCUG 14189 / LMG 1036 / NCIMB 9965 / AN6) TaxID=406817 RepID=D3VB34_XENNA|nr:hypothetical protein XNC1_3778 [Xenorhabdus nematophila ATCC 19061]CEE91337.1 hypothetical protein XNA1_2040026 [Xenorhabdus nematophila str. Anatoliense]CEF28740.1 hypothetical protein XNW1_1350025 [Xenorhabdus nematophila str. Websteri]CEK24628.1 hypothetical protein XNC2_3634 [Xenorhabdus nematophila AN6/1]